MEYNEMINQMEVLIENWYNREINSSSDTELNKALPVLFRMSITGRNKSEFYDQCRQIILPSSHSSAVRRLYGVLLYLQSHFPKKLFKEFKKNTIEAYVAYNNITKSQTITLINQYPIILFIPIIQQALYRNF